MLDEISVIVIDRVPILCFRSAFVDKAHVTGLLFTGNQRTSPIAAITEVVLRMMAFERRYVSLEIAAIDERTVRTFERVLLSVYDCAENYHHAIVYECRVDNGIVSIIEWTSSEGYFRATNPVLFRHKGPADNTKKHDTGYVISKTC